MYVISAERNHNCKTCHQVLVTWRVGYQKVKVQGYCMVKAKVKHSVCNLRMLKRRPDRNSFRLYPESYRGMTKIKTKHCQFRDMQIERFIDGYSTKTGVGRARDSD